MNIHRTNELLRTAVENDRNEARKEGYNDSHMDKYRDKEIVEGSGQPDAFEEWWEAQDGDKEAQKRFLDTLDDSKMPF